VSVISIFHLLCEKRHYRAPLLIPFGIPRQVFFSDARHQKRSLASLNEYFGNRTKVRWTFEPACAEARKKPKLENKMELLEVPLSLLHDFTDRQCLIAISVRFMLSLCKNLFFQQVFVYTIHIQELIAEG
jgi:hypothetical protein